MPGRHTAAQKRQARHVAESEHRRGKSWPTSVRIGWATVNKRKNRKGVMRRD